MRRLSLSRQAEVDGKLRFSQTERTFRVSGWTDGGDWMWMSVMLVFLLVVLGAFVYEAVRVGSRRSSDERR